MTVENDINLAAVGERWRGMARGVEDFVFLSVGTGLGAGLVLRGELHRGRHGAAGEVDLVAAGRDEEIDPCASAVSALAERLVSENGAGTTLRAAVRRPRPSSPRHAPATRSRGRSSRRRRAGSRSTSPRSRPSRTSRSSSSAAASASTRDLLLDPIRDRLTGWLPYPPRVEVSSLGDAAVLTGALAVGLRSAVDNVFANRLRVTR